MHLNVLLFYFSFFLPLFVHAVIHSYTCLVTDKKTPESEATEKYVLVVLESCIYVPSIFMPPLTLLTFCSV